MVFFDSLIDATFVFFWFAFTKTKIVSKLLFFRLHASSRYVLVFLTIHGLGAPVGRISASGALLYRLRLDQIVDFRWFWSWTKSGAVSAGHHPAWCLSRMYPTRRIVRWCENRFQLGWCSVAMQFLITFFLSYDFLFQRSRIQQAKILWGSSTPDSPPRIDSTAC